HCVGLGITPTHSRVDSGCGKVRQRERSLARANKLCRPPWRVDKERINGKRHENGYRASRLEGLVRPFSEDRPPAFARALCSRPPTRRALDGRSSRTLPRLLEEQNYR